MKVGAGKERLQGDYLKLFCSYLAPARAADHGLPPEAISSSVYMLAISIDFPVVGLRIASCLEEMERTWHRMHYLKHMHVILTLVRSFSFPLYNISESMPCVCLALTRCIAIDFPGKHISCYCN